jgi:UDP-N-acetylglucosamine 2-epimerase (non-hydrolysing)
MKKVLVVAGTRPEIIKLAPVLLTAQERYRNALSVSFCLTGQHHTMAQDALSVFGLTPDIRLDIMKPNQTINEISRAVFERLPSVIEAIKPDVLVVQGDTTTAAMAALCAFQMRVPVGHVEAGLRSFNLDAPYPEELNRKVINSLAVYNFCPTEKAQQNLLNEAIAPERMYLTGNTIVDAVQRIVQSHSLHNLQAIHPDIQPPYILITAHRRESFGEGVANICRAIRECARKFPSIRFVYPVHLNPSIHVPVHDLLAGVSNIVLIPPVSYLQLLTLLKHCLVVLTDSGGIQEEAPSFKKYCIVLREVTERTESIDMGISELVGTNVAAIVSAVERAVQRGGDLTTDNNPYGDGKASQRILDILSDAKRD